MFTIRGKTERARSYALFDIGASTVGVALGIRSSQEQIILWSTRVPYAYTKAEDYVRYEKAMYATLLEVAMTMTSEGLRIAKQHKLFSIHALSVLCVYAPPWFLGTVLEEHYRREQKQFEATQNIVDEIHARMFSTFLQSPTCTSWREVMGDPELLEQEDVAMWLDGYPVHRLTKQSVRELSIRSYLVVGSQSVTEHVRDIIHRVLPNHDLLITSSTRLFLQPSTRAHIQNSTYATHIDVSGHITTLSLIANNTLTATKTIPLGVHDLYFAYTPTAPDLTSAKESFDLHTKDGSPNDERTKELSCTLNEWATQVFNTITELSQGITPPLNILLTTSELYEVFEQVLTAPRPVPGVRSAQTMQVQPFPTPHTADEKAHLGPAPDERLLLYLQSMHTLHLHQQP